MALSKLPRFGTRAVLRSSDRGLKARGLTHHGVELKGRTRGGVLELKYDRLTARVALEAGLSPLEALMKLRREVPRGYLLPIDSYDADGLVFGVQKLERENEPYQVTANLRAAEGIQTDGGPRITRRELHAVIHQARKGGLTSDEAAELERDLRDR